MLGAGADVLAGAAIVIKHGQSREDEDAVDHDHDDGEHDAYDAADASGFALAQRAARLEVLPSKHDGHDAQRDAYDGDEAEDDGQDATDQRAGGARLRCGGRHGLTHGLLTGHGCGSRCGRGHGLSSRSRCSFACYRLRSRLCLRGGLRLGSCSRLGFRCWGRLL